MAKKEINTDFTSIPNVITIRVNGKSIIDDFVSLSFTGGYLTCITHYHENGNREYWDYTWFDEYREPVYKCTLDEHNNPVPKEEQICEVDSLPQCA